jgi:hypothetical protein
MDGTVAMVLTPLPAHGQIDVPEEEEVVVVVVVVVDGESDDAALPDEVPDVAAEPAPHAATRLEPRAAADTPSQPNAWRRDTVAVTVRLLMKPPV